MQTTGIAGLLALSVFARTSCVSDTTRVRSTGFAEANELLKWIGNTNNPHPEWGYTSGTGHGAVYMLGTIWTEADGGPPELDRDIFAPRVRCSLGDQGKRKADKPQDFDP